MKKLIKLLDTHYIIVDDSEIKEGDFVYHPEVSQEYTIINYLRGDDEKYSKGQHIAQGVYRHKPTTNEWYKKERKITYSTQPLEQNPHSGNKIFINIKQLNLSEVEELIYGYSVEKMAEHHWKMQYIMALDESTKHYIIEDYKSGFKAHQELVKNKLFTDEDMRRELTSLALEIATEDGQLNSCSPSLIYFWIKNKMQSLLPKTEWNIEIDEHGKIKLK